MQLKLKLLTNLQSVNSMIFSTTIIIKWIDYIQINIDIKSILE